MKEQNEKTKGVREPELLDAILAEMRDLADHRAADAGGERPAVELLRSYADRIEAAAERERDEDRQLAAIAESDEAFARCARCDRPERAPGDAAALREALKRILAIEGYGAPWIEAKCIAQKALEGEQCTPPIAQETAKNEQAGNVAATARDTRDAMQCAFDAMRKPTFLGIDFAKPTSPGNVAAMRAALERAVDAIETMCALYDEEHTSAVAIGAKWKHEDMTEVVAILASARAALSAPARNCDKYSLDDSKKMDRDFGAFCKQFGAKNGENCSGCPIKPMDNLCCHSTWMLLPAAEGGAE